MQAALADLRVAGWCINSSASPQLRRPRPLVECWYINAHNTLTTLARQLDIYRRELEICRKPYPAELPMRREVFVAGNREDAIRLARPCLKAKYKTCREWGPDKAMPSGDDFDHDVAGLSDDRFLIGSAKEVAGRLIDFDRRFGVNPLVASVHCPSMPNTLTLEQLKILAREVMPALRGA